MSLVNRIRELLPDAQIQIFLDHPKADSSPLVIQNNLKLQQDLKGLASEDTQLELVARERNLGTSHNLLDALDQIQGYCDGFVVLEDDCEPDPLFFDFANRAVGFLSQDSDKKAVIFCGANHLLPPLSSLSRRAFTTPLSHVWGWGGMSANLPDLTGFIRQGPSLGDKEKIRTFIRGSIPYAPYRNHWNNLLETNWGELSWDYRLQFWIWARGYQCLISGANLVRNIGFDPVATNSSNFPDHYQNKVAKRYTMQRLIHPKAKFLIWWELTGYRAFALVRLIRMALTRKGSV
jgi:hypothetical protein